MGDVLVNSANFKLNTIRVIMKQEFRDKKTKFKNDDTVALMAEVLQVFVTEAALRAANQAEMQAQTVVTTDHLEQILPQLLLDF